MAIELATAYVSILPETGKLKAEINKALGEVGKQSEGAGKTMGGKIASGMAKTAKAGLVAAGVGVGAAFAASISKGIGRLTAIQGAESTLKGLGHTAGEVKSIMDSANASVTGTAFGLGEAASISAQMVAAGIKPGKELTGVLTTIADSAVTANTDLGHMGRIFSKVAATGKLQGDEMNQIMEAGLPILQIIGTSTGKTAAEVRKMVTDGEVSFEIFEKAMTEKVGGAAQGANETVTGAMNNIDAAMGRFGATLIEGPFKAAPGVMQGVIEKIDKLNNATRAMFEYFSTGVADFGAEGIWTQAFGSKEAAQPYIDLVDDVKLKWLQFRAGFTDGNGTGMFGALGNSIREIKDAFVEAWPHIQNVVTSLMQAGLGTAIVGLVGVFGTLAPIIADVLAPALESLGAWMKDNQGAVNAIVAGLAGFMVLNGAAGSLNTFIGPAGKLAGILKKLAPGKLFKNFVDLGKTLGHIGKIAGGALWKGLTMAAGAVKALGLAIVANPIGAIITAIALVVAGLIYFFTQTETGKAIWQSFMDKLKEVWAWISTTFSGMWSGIVDAWNASFEWVREKAQAIGQWFSDAKDVVVSAFEKIGEVIAKVFEGIKIVFAVIATAVITPFVLLIKGLGWIVRETWENWILPTLDKAKILFRVIYESWIKPALDGIKGAWESMTTAIYNWWTTTLMPTIQAFGDKISELWNTYVQPIIDNIVAKWNWLQSALSAVWQNIKKNVFDAWNTAVAYVQAYWNKAVSYIQYWWGWLQYQLDAIWQKIKSTVFDAWNKVVEEVRTKWQDGMDFLSRKWDEFRVSLLAVWELIKTTIFNPIKDKIEDLKKWFSDGIDAIGRTWQKLKEKTAEPVNWVISTIFNQGIKPVWNTIAGLIGLKTIDEDMKTVGGYASGGVLPGYTPGRDPYTFIDPKHGIKIGLSGGEAIMRPEWTRAVGGPAAVAQMNRDARAGKIMPAGKHGREAYFANGGVIGAMNDIVKRKYPSMVLTSGLRPGHSGYHGKGLATDWATPGAFGNSIQQLSLANDIATTYPGSAQLIYDHPGWAGNIANGRTVGAFGNYYTLAEAGPHHNHVHWAMTVPPNIPFGGGVFEGGSDGGGGFSLNPITYLKGIWDKAIGAIKGYDKESSGGEFGKVPAHYLKTVAESAWNTIKAKAASAAAFFGIGNGGGGGEQYRDQIIEAFKFQGAEPKDHLVDALVRQIGSESNGDPNIAQQIVDVNGTGPSAGLGLYQFIPGTWAAYRDPRLPDDRTNPWAAHNAAVRYFRDKHGWNTGPGGVGRGHGWATGGVLPNDLMTLFDKGGAWPSGTLGANLSGATEYVFTNLQMRYFSDATESLSNAAEEIRKAYDGEDWGIGELQSMLGRQDWALAVVDTAETIGRGVRGFEKWAAASEDQDRMGTPEEWGIHFGQMAAYSFADDALGLLGLGGIIGSPLRQSLVDVINAGADVFNTLNPDSPFKAGHIGTNALQPVSLLDDTGRRVGTRVQANATAGAAASTPASDPAVSAPVKKTVSVQVEGDKVYTAEQVEELIRKLDDEIDEVKVDVDKLKSDNVTSVTASITTMA